MDLLDGILKVINAVIEFFTKRRERKDLELIESEKTFNDNINNRISERDKRLSKLSERKARISKGVSGGNK